MRNGKYILHEDGTLEKVDLLTWTKWFEESHSNRIVAINYFQNKEIRISTVFLGIDHRFSGVSDPILFETMIFGGVLDGFLKRYCTKVEALEGHQTACKEIDKLLKEDNSLC